MIWPASLIWAGLIEAIEAKEKAGYVTGQRHNPTIASTCVSKTLLAASHKICVLSQKVCEGANRGQSFGSTSLCEPVPCRAWNPVNSRATKKATGRLARNSIGKLPAKLPSFVDFQDSCPRDQASRAWSQCGAMLLRACSGHERQCQVNGGSAHVCRCCRNLQLPCKLQVDRPCCFWREPAKLQASSLLNPVLDSESV